MWDKVASFILRYRIWFLTVTVLLTLVMGYFATKIELTYEQSRMAPRDDPDYERYVTFKSTFGDDGSVMLLGLKSDKIFNKDFLNASYAFAKRLEKIDGVQNVLSYPTLQQLVKVDSIGEFRFMPVMSGPVKTQQEADSVWQLIRSLKFYNGLVINVDHNFAVTGITLNKERLNDKSRIEVIDAIVAEATAFEKEQGVDLKMSGLPYIRTVFSAKINRELQQFTLLSMVICAAIMLLFFRSFSSLLYSMVIVIISLVWNFGYAGLFDYKLTAVLGVLPPLIVIIGITNCIYLLNKYHSEYKAHNNKSKAVVRSVSKIGKAMFLINITTAIGFGSFYFTSSPVMKEFGLVAFLSIMTMYVISVITVPAMFSLLPPPTYKQTQHLENRYLTRFLDFISHGITNYRKTIYIVTTLICIVAAVGVWRMKALGYMVDDLPKKDLIVQDLKFFEEEINGVMPFEIVVDTRKPDGVKDLVTLQKIERLQRELNKMPEFSKAVSIAELMKFANQGYNGGDSNYYRLPGALDIAGIVSYMPKKTGKQNVLKGMTDSTYQKARISIQMKDVGSEELAVVTRDAKAKIDSIFPASDYTVNVTGTSIIFLKNNEFLVNNLIQSVIISLIINSLLMATLFGTLRMIFISLLPNLIPLLITMGIMGMFNIYLKPSTVIVFSVAFGISVDFTIHFIAKYRSELKRTNFRIKEAVTATLHESGTSMVYTAVILFFGFIIFSLSSFGGTMWLGILTSITLVVSLFANMLVLPATLLSLEKSLLKKEMSVRPMIDIDEEDDDNDNENGK